MKLSLEEILTLVEKVGEAGLGSFSYRDGDIRIKIQGPCLEEGEKSAVPEPVRKQNTKTAAGPENVGPETAAETVERSAQPEGAVQASPMVGIFYTSDTEGGEPLVHAGDTVKKGQVIGIIEAMKLMNEVRSEYDGTVAQVLAENGQIVEYGQPLFRFD
ncbi:MAG: acetyl-CoA carboxylase biotin carboxyl carrier protein [Lachnospiraceae bacterium]|nr:acetyl-CoA carboxylase biotin carboxyl carrier protein [Lachnospiraceae bacterium]